MTEKEILIKIAKAAEDAQNAISQKQEERRYGRISVQAKGYDVLCTKAAGFEAICQALERFEKERREPEEREERIRFLNESLAEIKLQTKRALEQVEGNLSINYPEMQKMEDLKKAHEAAINMAAGVEKLIIWKVQNEAKIV